MWHKIDHFRGEGAKERIFTILAILNGQFSGIEYIYLLGIYHQHLSWERLRFAEL